MKNYILYFLLLIYCLLGIVIGFPLKAWNDRPATLDDEGTEIDGPYNITESARTLELVDSTAQEIAIDSSALRMTIDQSQGDIFIFLSPDGRTAILDFSGEKITYSGNLPVDESARLFFERFGALWRG